jgi:HTH-type transcriptional regulator/antitoxin HigA
MDTKIAHRSSPSADRYIELVRRHPLRPIRDEGALRAAVSEVDRLVDLGEARTTDDDDYLEVLSLLIADYETRSSDRPLVTGAETLEYLIEEHKLSLSQLARETGIPSTTLSDILHGRRGISSRVRTKLCERFKVGPAVFL